MHSVSVGSARLLACVLVTVPTVAAHAQEATPTSEQPATQQGGSQEQVKFNVWEYRVLANSTLSNASIEQSLYDLTGPGKTMVDVENARQALEKTYRDAGFGTVFVDIPEQSADEGIVRLRVTEGRLERVRITGARYFSNGKIRAALPSLTRGGVPHLPDVQAQLTALNRTTSDRAVVPVLKAGRTPGTVDVELKVTDELPLHGSVEVNDRYTADTSRLRINASLSYDNLFQKQQSLSLQYQTAPEQRSEVEAVVASYVFRAPSWNTVFAVYGVDSNTDVAAIGTLSVNGKGQVIGARAIRALPEQESYFHSVTFGVDYKDFVESIRLDAETGLDTPISYFNWSLAYSSTQRWQRGTSGFNLGANLGMRGIGNSYDEFGGKRSQGAPNYFYLRGSIQHTHELPWTLQLFGKLSGQFTQDALVSNEQFAIGGADTVRGYLESSQLGDYGVAGVIELRSSLLARWLKRPPSSAYWFAFYDAGVVAVLDPLPLQQARVDIESVGLGIRINALYGFDAALDWARVLKDSGFIQQGDSRAHFTVRYSF